MQKAGLTGNCLRTMVKGTFVFVLIGDHYQLQPTITCDEAKSQCAGISVSMLEHWCTESDFHSTNPESEMLCNPTAFMLDTQYRSPPTIGTFIAEQYYQGRLKNGVTNVQKPLPG